MWNGLRAITDYKGGGIYDMGLSSSLADELNAHYARFEANNTSPATKLPVDQESCAPSISVSEVVRSFKAVNPRKTPGPDGIHNRVLRSCAIQLAEEEHLCENALDYSSAFKTIILAKLIPKLTDLGLNSHLCNWVLDFLTGRPQVVRVGNSFSSTLTLSTGAPQGCVLSPLLYSLFTHDYVARHTSNTIFKFADDTTILGLITDGDETAYRDEVSALSEWCYHNNLNISKTKKMIVDYRKLLGGGHSPLYINGAEVERVSSVRFLGVHLTDDLSWSLHTNKVVRSARQRLFYLRRLRKFGPPPDILTNFYRCTIESILTACITVWYGSCP
ncbi:hypothetical protein NFI96_010350 [Prochilodus magdalenae]|nr:hypothetical protein NFI96_010350 [Prochilodus magdalenae]